MPTNISIQEEINFFSWDIDGTMWSSFNTPFAHNVYTKLGIVLFLFISEIICFTGTTLLLFLCWLVNISLWIEDVKKYFSKDSKKKKDEVDLKAVTTYFEWLSWIWHGHEIFGLDNIPDEPTVFYIYHGTYSIDGLYAYIKILNASHRPLIATADKLDVKIYGFRRLHRATNYLPYTREQVVDHLNNGGQYLLAGGGTKESRISDRYYRVYRSKRTGIAHVIKATNVNVAIVPVFTKNIKEAFWIPWYLKPLLKVLPTNKVYTLPIVGGLPTKLKTYIGKKIEYDKSMAPEEIMQKIFNGLQAHIDEHQIIPGNRLRALRERFRDSKIDSNPIV